MIRYIPQCLIAILYLTLQSLAIRPSLCCAAEQIPGLIAKITLPDGSTAERVDAICDWKWESPATYDERLAIDQPTKIQWVGSLNVKQPGNYQLAVMCEGQAQLLLDNQLTLEVPDRSQTGARLVKSNEKELSLGFHEITISYQCDDPSGQLQIFWRGPGFQWEPITERYLSHDADKHPSDNFERGRLLARGLRCVACHESVGHGQPPTPLSAPDLLSLKGNLEPNWLVYRLMESSNDVQPNAVTIDQELRDDAIARRMPHFGLDRQDAVDIAHALWEASKAVDQVKLTREFESKSGKSKSKDKNPPRTQPSAQEGRLIVLTRGCVACHELSSESIVARDEDNEANYTAQARQDFLSSQLFAGGDLSSIGSKRPADFFARWLAKPASINPVHRMPEANLTDLEREDVSLYLASLKTDKELASNSQKPNAKRGAELIRQHRCANCHTLPKELTVGSPKKIPLGDHWDGGCLTSENAVRTIPGFHLTAGQRKALQVFFAAVRKGTTNDSDAKRFHAELQMAENNCFACHARQNHNGLVARAMQVIEKERDLAARLPAMLPPSLNGVGDKLHDAALASAIATTTKPHRPWLDVRMPRYSFDESQVKSLVSAFVQSDRMPSFDENTKTPLPDDVVTRSAAGRLVTSEGFGCQSCHQIGNQPSPTVALGARGTDLTMLGNRIRQSWYDRWVRNPIRIVPRMEMPAIQLPVHGVLGNDLDRQIDAVWEMLNTKGFQPPAPAPVRVVRKHNLPGSVEAAHVLTDVLESTNHNYLRPLIVGFQNRHNLLFDLESGEIGKWWIGDTARELTRGKSWYWELGGQPLGAKLESLVRFELLDKSSERWKPQAIEQFAVDFDELEHTERGVKVKARMHFSKGDQRQTVPFECHMEPNSDSLQMNSGIALAFRFNLPAEYQVVVRLGDATSKQVRTTKGPLVVLDEHTQIAFAGWSKLYDYAAEDGISIAAQSPGAPIACEISFGTDWPVDQFLEVENLVATEATATPSSPSTTTLSANQTPVTIGLVPGFDGLQLPLPRNEMPTALSWHEGRLVIGSLKGRVLFARDTNNDGLEDTWQAISDDLPAPYGIASNGDSIDVLAKYGLVRLSPSPIASAPWKMQVVADGWGYTADYHDWAVGLVKDRQSNYVIALPCQQDDRAPSAARLRGTVQRLIPQSPTSSDPRRFRLETIAAGQRFPMGLAIDVAGRLFATDNQGNYNPFNELNHIQEGKRYGFINKLENKPGFNPPLESAAVNLPHPWTRSVNGICFLNTPTQSSSPKQFGPFEGHAIGCEYNGLSLIRMSLEEIDGVMQGAAYMFSMPALPGESTFEGPVVCEVSPEGELVVGNIHDSGWGGGQNTGSIVKLKPNGKWRQGIAEVKALKSGLRIIFTLPLDPATATNVSNYTIRSYRRVSTPAYGGNDQEERQEPVLEAKVTGESIVDLTLNALRADSVYEVRVGKLAELPLFPDEAHYTMKKLP